MFQKVGDLVVPVFILKAFFNDKAKGALAFHPFNNTEATASKIDNFFLWIKLIVVLELFEDAVKMCLFS